MARKNDQDVWDPVVHQAEGMIAAQIQGPIEEATRRLTAAATHSGRSVSQVAGDVVARRIRLTPD